MTEVAPSGPREHAVIILPWPLERSFVREQVEDLARSPAVVVVQPGRLPLSSLGRLPALLARPLAWLGARILRVPAHSRVFMIFHPWQVPVARALIARHPGAELWFSSWDRYDAGYSEGYYAPPRLGRRLVALQEEAASTAMVHAAASTKLVDLETQAGRPASLVPLSADAFPAPDPGATVVAVSLGHLGRRTDWTLLRGIAERMPELVVLLVGSWSERENRDDPDFHACRALTNLVWLGYRSEEEAARLILCADVGLVLYRIDDYNDAALPHRILKYARLGRVAITPDLAGARTWEPALHIASGPDEWVAALRSFAGARTNPDAELRAWALTQTVRLYNGPLWDRLETLGIARRTPLPAEVKPLRS